jgi:hypothetical protein
MPLVIHCADIGSVKNRNFGWARLGAEDAAAECTTGHDIKPFVESIVADLNAGSRVALGFECPLFVPVSEDPAGLTSARPGEGDRAWSAGAGAGSLATGLTETVWVLDQVGRQLPTRPKVFVKWPAFREAERGLFIWEAFVTKAAKADTHHGDAELAALSFREALPNLEKQNAVVCEGTVRSLFGAALLQTGWVKDLSWLHEPCIVVRAQPVTKSGITSGCT